MFKQLSLLKLGILLGYLWIACFPFIATASPETPGLIYTPSKEIYILHTNNTNGALENCLCPGKSYGSLEKRIVYIREWLFDHPNTIVLDAGDFLSPTRNTLKDSIAFRGYELIQYDVVGLGDQEFFHGVQFLANLMKDSRLSFISTNLSKPELPNVRDEIVIEREGVSFGILSIMDPGIFRFYPKSISAEVQIEPYEDILATRVGELRNRVDVVVLLSHLGIEKDRELASSISGIDVIIGSHTQTVLEEPEQVGNTIIVQAGKDGYYVGQLKLKVDETDKILGYEGKLIPMDISLPNDSMMVAMIVEYNRLNRLRAGARVERIVPIPPEFIVVPATRCGSCHPEQLAHWETTSHAASLETLKHEHKDKSPDCLACHTTGFGRDDGYLNYNITAGLKTVNCTECHYVSSDHLIEPTLNLSEPVVEERCIRCHNQENSPEFEFDSSVSKIQHPIEKVEIAVIETEKAGEQIEGEQKVSEPPPTFIVHQVQAGETLWSLAGRYMGENYRWGEIYELNRENIENPNVIFVGQIVKIPIPNKGE